jgi:hypothetical protein
MAASWQDASRKILDALDIRAEYAALGLDVTGREPDADGWLECRAFGREDRNPSAGIIVGAEHPTRGRYKEFSGDARNLSLFEFAAVAAGKFLDWKAAKRHYAKQAGVKLPQAPKMPEDNFVFRDWNTNLVQTWCLKKPPIVPTAVKLAGGRLAGWPASTQRFTVVCLPIFGPHGADDDPTGWVLWNKSGKPLPLYQGEGRPEKSVKMLTAGGSTSGWMNAHGLAHVAAADVVWKTEGPGDMLALLTAIPDELRDRHVVLTNSGGCGEVPRDEFLDLLAGRRVFVVGDADQPGQAGAAKWAAAIAETAAECRVVVLPYEVTENHGKDLRDWLAEGGTYAALLALAEAAAVVEPERPPDDPAVSVDAAAVADKKGHKDPLAHDRAICECLKIDVLGELPDRKIKIFSETHGKNITVESANRLSYPDLLQMFGPIVREKVHLSNDQVEGMHHLNRVKEAIAVVAGAERAGEGVELGQGCWAGREDGNGGNDSVVLVGAGEAAVWNGKGTLERIRRPRAAGLKFDISFAQHWYDYDRLSGYLRQAESGEWCQAVVTEAINLFGRWYWRSGQDTIPQVVAGLILASWVQTLWEWRPMVSITGPSDCGKSTLFSTLETLFGPLALFNAKSSEAGLRQAIGNHGKVVLCDEFENDAHRKKILELLRTSSRGAKTLRGTAGQGGMAFGLRHICWVAAVEVGMDREPDRNRFITLELTKPPADCRGKLALPTEPQLEDLGQRLLAIAVRHVLAARRWANLLKGHAVEGFHGRVVESYAVPVGMLATVLGVQDEGQAHALLLNTLDGVGKDPTHVVSDEDDLVDAILSSPVGLPRGETATVAQILSNPNDYSDGWTSLDRVGIGPVAFALGRRPHENITERDGIFFAHSSIRRLLLKGTRWEDQAIEQILRRVEGAEKSRRRMGGRLCWGTVIPWKLFAAKCLGSEDAGENAPGEF